MQQRKLEKDYSQFYFNWAFNAPIRQDEIIQFQKQPPEVFYRKSYS